MPLRDHFTASVDPRGEWPSFHVRWASETANELDRTLTGQFRVRLEVYHPDAEPIIVAPSNPQLAPPTQSIPFHPGDTIAVEVYDLHGSLSPAAVVQWVSPSNKSHPQSRKLFAAACHASLSQGAGVVVVDTVTDHASLLREIVDFNSLTSALLPSASVYVAAGRPVFRKKKAAIDFWTFPLAIGEPLPIVPLYIRGHDCVPLNLDALYDQTCRNCNLTG